MNLISQCARFLVGMVGVAALLGLAAPGAGAWEPSRPVEFIIPAGTGGGADIMARMISATIAKHNLAKVSFLPINKSGGAGAEGFLDVKNDRGNSHKIIITLSNLFTTPLATGTPFNWRDLTPVAMLALDEFILWVPADAPYKTAKEYIDAAKAANGTFKMAGTGAKQEDQIITAAIEQQTGAKFIYVPFAGGGAVATQLVGKHVNSTVNNPNEAVGHWRGGKVKPLCVFDTQRLPVTEKMTETMAWSDIPTCKESGLDMNYLMLRGIFMPPGVGQEVVDYYVDLFKKVRTTPEWADLMKNGAFNPTFMTGKEYVQWVEHEEARHKSLMEKAGFLHK